MVTGYPDSAYLLQLVYFLPMLIPILIIWTVEGYRHGNNQTFVGRFVSL